jgi:WD40 repeat protein
MRSAPIYHSLGNLWLGCRLWSRSKNPAISHHPLPTSISLIHVMADHGLLSASTRHAVVRRSFPLKNKAIKGYLYGTGEPPGLGNGLPNTNLMPDISTCALTSDGTTAKVIWGRQDGSVIFVSHPRTMSGTQAPARVHTSAVRQEHDGAVLGGTWAASGDVFVTGGSDGRVKVWTVTPFRCTWTSESHLSGRELDPITQVSENLAEGFVVAASRSGDIIIFSGFDAPFQSAANASQHNIRKLCISTRNLAIPDVEPLSGLEPLEISALFFQFSSPTNISILAFYLNTSWFSRCSVDVLSKHVDVKTFGNAAFGIIRCMQPAFSNNPLEPSFILAGTQLGVVSIYEWDSTSLSDDPIPASRHVDVFSDAPVTSLAVNPFVIIAGSSRGSIMVLDILTFETLRSFTVSTPNEVRQIELAGDVLVASTGSEVLAWSASHFRSSGKSSVKIKGKWKQGGHGKWYSKYLNDLFLNDQRFTCLADQLEFKDDIADLVEEAPLAQRSLSPEREQLMELHNLGLTELEAVEYTLMLSRDEELQKLRKSTDEHEHEEGIFDADESSNSQSGSDQSILSSFSVGEYSPPPLRPSNSRSSTSSYGHPVPLASPSSSNTKVQVSPRFYPEPMEAGGLFGSPSEPQSIPQGKPTFFPSSSYSQSPREPITPLATPPKQNSAGIRTPSGKPSAWNKPLPGTGLAASPSAPTGQPLPFSHRRSWEVEVERIRQVEDMELRFALELSLAEAETRERSDGGT